MMKRQLGFTLPEILVALAISAVVFAGVSNLLSTNRRVAIQEQADARLQGNMRLATTELSRTLRNVGYGVPASGLASWVPWVTGFSDNPVVTQGTGAAPDTVMVAHCTLTDLTTLSANAAQGDTTITVASTAGIDTAAKRFLTLDVNEHAHVTSISGSTLTIDTDALTAGLQGLSKALPSGAPICRVDVKTFDLDTATSTIRVDYNDGIGPMVVADEISDLQIVVGGAGSHFSVAISGESRTLDPVTGGRLARTITTNVSRRN